MMEGDILPFLCLQHIVQPAGDLPARLPHRLFPDKRKLQGVSFILLCYISPDNKIEFLG